MFSVFVLRRKKKNVEEDVEEFAIDDEFHDDTYNDNDVEGENNNDYNVEGSGDAENESGIKNDGDNLNQNNSTVSAVDESQPTNATVGEEPLYSKDSYATTVSNSTSEQKSGDQGTRALHQRRHRRQRRTTTADHRDRWLQHQNNLADLPGGYSESANESSAHSNIDGKVDNIADDCVSGVASPSFAPISGVGSDEYPAFVGNSSTSHNVAMDGIPTGSSTFAPDFASNATGASVPTLAPNATVGLDYNNSVIGGIFDGNVTTNISSSAFPTMSPVVLPGKNDTSFNSSIIVDQTVAYFRSPGFAVAMVVNVSIFFAFTGLLKLYHAVQTDLSWCRPFPKFLTIKAVVFLTFWQGLVILLSLVLTAEPDEKEEALLLAHRYQNLLICVEMLLVAISQWVSFVHGNRFCHRESTRILRFDATCFPSFGFA